MRHHARKICRQYVGESDLLDSSLRSIIVFPVQLGLVISGLSLGVLLLSPINRITQLKHDYRVLIGPPVGGALYSRLGYRSPFIFGIVTILVDMIGRLLIIERKDSLKMGD